MEARLGALRSGPEPDSNRSRGIVDEEMEMIDLIYYFKKLA